MKTVLKFRGAALEVTNDGRLFVRYPYRGVFAVQAGDLIRHSLGSYVVTGREAAARKEAAHA